MTWEALQIGFVLVLVALVFFGFIRERLPPDVVAMLAFSALLLTTVLTPKEALSVFSSSGPITVACMFVLSAALERTGSIERMGALAIRVAGHSPAKAFLVMTLGVMVASAFINNTPVVVILTPVAILLARTLKIAPSKLLIPLSFASIFGGTTTLIGTSTNLLVNGVAVSYGLPAISMFEITAPGVLLGIIGIIYMAVFGHWLLPDRTSSSPLDRPHRSFLAEVLIPYDSPLVGKNLAEAGLTPEQSAEIVDVIRRNRSLRYSLDQVVLGEGDRLVLRTQAADVIGLRETGALLFGSRQEHAVEPLGSEASVVMEGVVGPQSRLIGYRIADLNFRRLYGVYILAVHRQGGELHGNFDDITLRFGDVLLLEGPPDGLRRLFERRVLVNLSQPSERPFRRDKAPIAIAAIASVMLLASLEVLPIEALAIAAATAVVALGCLTPDEAYEAVHTKSLEA